MGSLFGATCSIRIGRKQSGVEAVIQLVIHLSDMEGKGNRSIYSCIIEFPIIHCVNFYTFIYIFNLRIFLTGQVLSCVLSKKKKKKVIRNEFKNPRTWNFRGIEIIEIREGKRGEKYKILSGIRNTRRRRGLSGKLEFSASAIRQIAVIE